MSVCVCVSVKIYTKYASPFVCFAFARFGCYLLLECCTYTSIVVMLRIQLNKRKRFMHIYKHIRIFCVRIFYNSFFLCFEIEKTHTHTHFGCVPSSSLSFYILFFSLVLSLPVDASTCVFEFALKNIHTTGGIGYNIECANLPLEA